RPFTKMVEYLDGMDAAPYHGVPPAEQPIRVLAALGPQMLRLAGQRAAGAGTYLVTPEHTAQARSLLGADPLLAVAHAVGANDGAPRGRPARRTDPAFYPPPPHSP